MRAQYRGVHKAQNWRWLMTRLGGPQPSPATFSVLLALCLSVLLGCAATVGMDSLQTEVAPPGASVRPGRTVPTFDSMVGLDLEVVPIEIRAGRSHSSEIATGLNLTLFRTYELKFFDVDATWRYFPAVWQRFRPYFGAGGGYYRLAWKEVWSTCPPGYICIPGSGPGGSFQDSELTTFAAGFNPHVVAGANMPIGRGWWWVVEARRELLKKDPPVNLETTRLSLGVRWKPPPGFWK
jgi:hypothetical protein